MKVIASVQVRMGSERLPGKVMRPLSGKPALWYLANRLRRCKTIDDIVISTPLSRDNDVVADFCDTEEINCYRGSEDDVLMRLLESLQNHQADIGVVVYGDNPLIDPTIVDELVTLFDSGSIFDWIGNDLTTTFPPGMEVEVFKVNKLSDSSERVRDMSVREHGTLAIRQNPAIYRLHNVEASGTRRRPELHLGIDTPVDVEVVSAILKHFRGELSFTLEDIIDFLDQHPEIPEKNRKIPRRWRQYRKQ